MSVRMGIIIHVDMCLLERVCVCVYQNYYVSIIMDIGLLGIIIHVDMCLLEWVQ